jgi:hypothetical protein
LAADPPPQSAPALLQSGCARLRRVSAETEHAVELFVRREDAEAFLEDVRGDDEELAGTLRLEPVELDA